MLNLATTMTTVLLLSRPDGMSAHLKYYLDVSHSLIKRCQRGIGCMLEECGGGLSMCPVRKDRKRQAEGPPDTPSTAPATPVSATLSSTESNPASEERKRTREAEFQHLPSSTEHQGPHKFGSLGGRAKCVVCIMLGLTASAWTTACAKCRFQKNSKGLQMCENHWKTEIEVAMHPARGDTAGLMDRLEEFDE